MSEEFTQAVAEAIAPSGNNFVDEGSAEAAELRSNEPPRKAPRSEDEVQKSLEDRAGDHHAYQEREEESIGDTIDDSQDYQAHSFQKIQEDLAKNYELTQQQHFYLNQKSTEIFEGKQILDDEYSKVNWDALKQSDPQRYMLLQHEFRDAYSRVQNDYQQLQNLASTQKQKMQDQYQNHLQQQMSMVKRMIPSWQDENTMKKETAIIRSELIKQYGFNDDELNSVTDARLVRVLRDLIKYKQANKKNATSNRLAAKQRATTKKVRQKSDGAEQFIKGSSDWVTAKLRGRM
jgi:hypothetical protein